MQVILNNFPNTDLSDSVVKILEKLIQDEAGILFLVSNNEETRYRKKPNESKLLNVW